MENQHLTLLYPDVDPSRPIPPTYGERLSLVVASIVLAFGAAAGDLLVMAVGLVLVLIAAVAPMLKTPRRIRNEARSRFPDEPWAEDAPQVVPLAVSYPVTWLFIIAIVGSALWFVPEKYTLWGAGVAAFLVALVVWFMPGLSPVWTERPKPEQEEFDFSELPPVLPDQHLTQPIPIVDAAQQEPLPPLPPIDSMPPLPPVPPLPPLQPLPDRFAPVQSHNSKAMD